LGETSLKKLLAMLVAATEASVGNARASVTVAIDFKGFS
jgi:hypothetical protein